MDDYSEDFTDFDNTYAEFYFALEDHPDVLEAGGIDAYLRLQIELGFQMDARRRAAEEAKNEDPARGPIRARPQAAGAVHQDRNAAVETEGKGKGRAEELCTACTDAIQGTIYTLPCFHSYCRECLQELLQVSMHDGPFPPKCCGTEVPGAILRRVANAALFERYELRHEEHAAGPNALYCPQPRCAAFIPRGSSCPKCRTRVCVRCKAEAHAGACEQDAHEKAFQSLKEKEGWRACPACARVVEKVFASCNHMTCRCGAEWCWTCGEPWAPRRCNCVVWDMDALTAVLDTEANEDWMNDPAWQAHGLHRPGQEGPPPPGQMYPRLGLAQPPPPPQVPPPPPQPRIAPYAGLPYAQPLPPRQLMLPPEFHQVPLIFQPAAMPFPRFQHQYPMPAPLDAWPYGGWGEEMVVDRNLSPEQANQLYAAGWMPQEYVGVDKLKLRRQVAPGRPLY